MNTNFRLLAPGLFLMLCSGEVVAGSLKTSICLTNETSDRKLILVEGVDNYDWDGFSRPDHNWNGTYVEAGQTRCERAEINTSAISANFSFVINGTDQVHKFRMEFAVDGDEGWMVLLGRDPSSSILRGAETSRHEDYEIGGYCGGQSSRCYEFYIRDVP